MAGRKTTSKKSNGSASKISNRRVKINATSARPKLSNPRSDRIVKSRSDSALSTANELGLRAWKTTYQNNRNNREA